MEAVCKGRCPTAQTCRQKGTTKPGCQNTRFCPNLSQLIQLSLTFTDNADIKTILSFLRIAIL